MLYGSSYGAKSLKYKTIYLRKKMFFGFIYRWQCLYCGKFNFTKLHSLFRYAEHLALGELYVLSINFFSVFLYVNSTLFFFCKKIILKVWKCGCVLYFIQIGILYWNFCFYWWPSLRFPVSRDYMARNIPSPLSYSQPISHRVVLLQYVSLLIEFNASSLSALEGTPTQKLSKWKLN